MSIESTAAADDWRINNFDLIRLLAALQVAIVHTMSAFKMYGIHETFFNLGVRMFPGVPIFFVISGYLISKSYERSNSLRDYYRNRCLRIFPALWVCLAASVGVILIAGVSVLGAVSTRDWLTWWAAQMSLYQQFGPVFLQSVGMGSLNGSLWTIPVELEFYLLLPVIYAAFRLRQRRGDLALLCLLAGSVVLHFVYCRPSLFPIAAPHTFLVETAVPYLWIFLVGVLMQRHWISVRGWLAGRTHWWLLGYLFICVAIGGACALVRRIVAHLVESALARQRHLLRHVHLSRPRAQCDAVGGCTGGLAVRCNGLGVFVRTWGGILVVRRAAILGAQAQISARGHAGVAANSQPAGAYRVASLGRVSAAATKVEPKWRLPRCRMRAFEKGETGIGRWPSASTGVEVHP
jgi:peptidoglycan/LPS O-acetylase OafA/YrhL